MNKNQWTYLVLETAKEHPDWLDVTFQAFSAGVREQARVNGSETANAYAALIYMYDSFPRTRMSKGDQEALALAGMRILDNGYVRGTGGEERIIQELENLIAKNPKSISFSWGSVKDSVEKAKLNRLGSGDAA